MKKKPQQTSKLKNKTENPEGNITGFLNYYHYFVQPDQRIYNVSILHTTENQIKKQTFYPRNYAYNDHDLVTRPPNPFLS